MPVLLKTFELATYDLLQDARVKDLGGGVNDNTIFNRLVTAFSCCFPHDGGRMTGPCSDSHGRLP
jgi:hypothetical protein